MVAKVYVAQFLPLHEYKETKIIISDINNENFFNLNGKTITNLGWKNLFAQTDNTDIILPNVNKNSTVSIYNYTIEEKETTPPTRYTTSTLLQAMKEIHKYCKYEENKNLLKGIGVGTEATRSNIIEKLLKEDFIFENKDKFLYPTEKGIMINNLLPETIKYPDETGLWEKELEEIKGGNLSINEFLESKKSKIEAYSELPPLKKWELLGNKAYLVLMYSYQRFLLFTKLFP